MLKLIDTGKQYRNGALTNGTLYRPVRFIFANVPGLIPNSEPADDEQIPLEFVVHTSDVTQRGKVDNDYVLFSVVLDTDVGDFTYNWLGLVAEQNGEDVLLMVKHGNLINKVRTIPEQEQEGNTLARTFGQRFVGAAGLANVTIPAESWQLDQTPAINRTKIWHLVTSDETLDPGNNYRIMQPVTVTVPLGAEKSIGIVLDGLSGVDDETPAKLNVSNDGDIRTVRGLYKELLLTRPGITWRIDYVDGVPSL